MIPQRSDEIARYEDFEMDWASYRRRIVAEQCDGCLKEYKRFDRLASSFLSFLKLDVLQRYPRIIDPPGRALSRTNRIP